MKPNLIQSASLLIAAIAFLSLVQPAYAATAAGAGIELDGKYIGGFTTTWSKETRENIIGQLSRRQITFERDYKIPVDAKDPNVASLTGRIRLFSKIRGDRQVMATVKSLQLVKRGGKWFVEAASLKRALKKAQKNRTENQEAEQGGTDQPATAPQSKPEGKEKVKPKSDDIESGIHDLTAVRVKSLPVRYLLHVKCFLVQAEDS